MNHDRLCYKCRELNKVKCDTLPCGHPGCIDGVSPTKICNFCNQTFNILSCRHFQQPNTKEMIDVNFNCSMCNKKTGFQYLGHLTDASHRTCKYDLIHCKICDKYY